MKGRKRIAVIAVTVAAMMLSAWIGDEVTKNKQRRIVGEMISMAVYFRGVKSESKLGESTETVVARINEARNPGITFVRSHANPFPDLLSDWDYDFADAYNGPNQPLIKAKFSYWLKPDKIIIFNWSGDVVYDSPQRRKRKSS